MLQPLRPISDASPREAGVLDLRDLPPPEPLQRALEVVAALEPGQQVVVLTPFRPAHLIEQLHARGCDPRSDPLEDYGWRTEIRFPRGSGRP